MNIVPVIEQVAITDDDGNVIQEPVMAPGIHVNSDREIPDWSEYQLEAPSTPTRVYAAPAATYFYCFPDEESFDSALASLEGY